MEDKKSKETQLEDRRPTWFLLGLVLALSVLYVALDYTSVADGYIDDEELLEDLSIEMDPLPLFDTRKYKVAVSEENGNISIDRLKVVERVETVEDEGSADEENADEDNGLEIAVGGDETDAVDKPAVVDDEEDETPLDLRVVEQVPEFPGGMEGFVRWLTSNLKYPQKARDRKLEGKVVVSFIVNRDGSVTDVELQKAVDPLLDSEALRVVRLMPEWKPGLDNAKPCRTMIAIPIVFKI